MPAGRPQQVEGVVVGCVFVQNGHQPAVIEGVAHREVRHVGNAETFQRKAQARLVGIACHRCGQLRFDFVGIPPQLPDLQFAGVRYAD